MGADTLGTLGTLGTRGTRGLLGLLGLLGLTLLSGGCAGSRAPERLVIPLDELSVKPGVNDNYKSPELSVTEYQGRFETESREVFALRHEILAALDIGSGDDVADIGAGTGVYTQLFSEAVGGKGQVYAVELAPNFIAHLTGRKNDESWKNVDIVTCTDRSAELERNSIDLAFVCDTYHHFEFPMNTLASLRKALRPGGRLVVIDFERIPGVSDPWILDHVRAGRETFVAEILRAGFTLEGELDQVPLEENYMLVFRSPS